MLTGLFFCCLASGQEKAPLAPAVPDAKSVTDYWREPGALTEPEVFPDCPEAAEDQAAVKRLADRRDQESPAMEAEWSKTYGQLTVIAQRRTEGKPERRAVNAARLISLLHKIHGDAKERARVDRDFIGMALEAEGKTVGAHRAVTEFDRRIYFGDIEGLDAARSLLLEKASPDDLAPYDLYRVAVLAMVAKAKKEDQEKAAKEAEPLCRTFLKRFPDHARTPEVKVLLSGYLACLGRRQEEIQLLLALIDSGQAPLEAWAHLAVAYDIQLLREEFKSREEIQAAYDRLKKLRDDYPEFGKQFWRILKRFEERLAQSDKGRRN